jgi:hypothetical protein
VAEVKESEVQRIVDKRLKFLKAAQDYVKQAVWMKEQLEMAGWLLHDDPSYGCPRTTTWSRKVEEKSNG